MNMAPKTETMAATKMIVLAPTASSFLKLLKLFGELRGDEEDEDDADDDGL